MACQIYEMHTINRSYIEKVRNKMLFDLKQYRQTLYPLWKLKRLRQAPKINSYGHFIQQILIITILLGVIMVKGCNMPAMAYSIDNLADAIYKTENSNKHPYGIMSKYNHTSPRQACVNTIKHRLKSWDRKGDFITYLGLTYSPPKINPNWVRLVHYFINHSKKG